MCSGYVCSRKHNSLIFKKNTLFGGKFKIAAVQTDHFRCFLISQDPDEIS